MYVGILKVNYFFEKKEKFAIFSFNLLYLTLKLMAINQAVQAIF